MPIKRSIKARLYIFKRYLPYTLSFTIIYLLFSFFCVSNAKLLYPSNIAISYKTNNLISSNQNNLLVSFERHLSSIEFLEKLRLESDYSEEISDLSKFSMQLKLSLSSLLPKNLSPSSWSYGMDFLQKSLIWKHLRERIKLSEISGGNIIEINCLGQTPIGAQSICETAAFLLTKGYLKKTKETLTDSIDLYSKDALLIP